MLNEDVFNKLAEKYKRRNMVLFSEMISFMYNIMYADNPQECNECKFEKDWWEKRYIELLTESFN